MAFALVIPSLIPETAEAQRSRDSWRTQMASSTEGSGLETETRETEITNWRRQSAVAQTTIESLGADRVESIPIPVLFGITRSNITSDFGDPRGGGTRSHEGQDLISKTGVPIVSPTDAVVTNVGYGASSGYFVYTANPGGETFVYMHLSEPSKLTRGTRISRGDLVGFAGNTGNASGGVSHLHFEIRKNGATDPYPRLTAEFSGQEKINFLNAILSGQADPVALANLLVGYYPSEFRSIRDQGVTLPSVIETALSNAPASTAGSAGASGQISLGSSGAAVSALQTYLIRSDKGPGARALGGAGATGYFGPITQTALVEFQGAVGISPTSGIYDSSTQTYVAQNPVSAPAGGGTTGTPTTSAPATPTTPSCVGYGCPRVITGTTPSSASAPTRDLGNGSSGSDVVWLQTLLINANKGSAAGTLASAGATGYFGGITQRALSEYQAAVGVSPASGYFGPITKAYLRGIGQL